jgi:hypothetical protein
MTTADLRSLVKTAATGIPGAKLWPNGLGFDHHGTQYHYAGDRWCASRDCPQGIKVGYGSTPEAAKRTAGIGRPEHRIRGGRS